MFKKNFKGIMSTVLIVCFSFFSYNKDYEDIFNDYLCYFKEKLEYKTKKILVGSGYELMIPKELYDDDVIFGTNNFLKSVDTFDVIPITKKEYKMLFEKVGKLDDGKSEIIKNRYIEDSKYKKNRITIDLDIFNKSIKKVMSEVKTEKDKLFLFYVYFYELFKYKKSRRLCE